VQKILIPSDGENLSKEFSKSRFYRIYHLSKNHVFKEETVDNSKLKSELLPVWILKKKITDVIVDKIEGDMLDKINQLKINVFVGVKPKKMAKIIDDLMQGTIETENNTIV